VTVELNSPRKPRVFGGGSPLSPEVDCLHDCQGVMDITTGIHIGSKGAVH